MSDSPGRVTSARVADDTGVRSKLAGLTYPSARKSRRVLLKGPVKDKLKRFGLFARLGEETFCPTLSPAISSYPQDDWAD